MVRSFEGKNVPLVAVSRVTGTIRVYDPAMCCSTGVCGPAVDPELIRLTNDLRWLEAQGIKIERFNLSQQPGAFVENLRVAGLLQAFGEKALPITLINETILAYGHYPSREEMIQVLTAHTESPSQRTTGSCCEPGSGCCS